MNNVIAMPTVCAEPVLRKVLVTPKMAREMLEASIGNRSISRPRVQQYADDMLADNWRSMPSQPIGVSTDGRLMNGHHRLMAVLLTGKSVLFYIVYGEDAENMPLLDLGWSRNYAQNRQIATGDVDSKAKEAAIKVMLAFFHRGAARRYSPSFLDKTLHHFEDAFARVLSVEKIKKKAPAPYLAALVFCYDLHPDVVVPLAAQIAARDAPIGTLAGGVLRLIADPSHVSNTTDRVKAFSASVGGVERHVRGEKIDFLRENPGAVNRLNAARKRVGLFSFSEE